MPATDYRLQVGFITHPKTKKLIRIAGHEAVCCLLRLIEFCATTRGRSEGVFDRMDWDDIEIAADWTGERFIFVKAMVSVGFFDENKNGTLSFHQFEEHNPWVFGADARSAKGRRAANARHHAKTQKRLAKTPKTACSEPEIACPVSVTDTVSDTETDSNSGAKKTDTDGSEGISVLNRGKGDCYLDVEKQKKEEQISVSVQLIWSVFREGFPESRRAFLRADDTEYKMVVARLKDFGRKEIIESIRGYQASSFYGGKNFKLETFLKDSASVELGLSFARRPETKKTSDRRESGGEWARIWNDDDNNDERDEQHT